MSNAFEKVSSSKALAAAWKDKQKRLLGSCFGVDRVSGVQFQRSLEANLKRLQSRLRDGFQPGGLLAIAKPKEGGGHRIICVPTIADRVVQFSLLQQLRPSLQRSGLDNPISFGLARGKARSVIGARQFACNTRLKHRWVYKADIHKFFDTIDRDLLRHAMRSVVSQRSLHGVMERFLESEISDGIEPGWRKVVSGAGIKAGVGVRQGMPLSPFFAAAYLRGLDKWLLRRKLPAARYVDDIVVFFDTEKEARAFHPQLSNQMQRIGLNIGELGAAGSKTRLYSPTDPADFLGMEITLTGDRYCLCVSKATLEKIGEKFAKLSRIPDLAERGVQLTTLGTFLQAMHCGYRNAYDAAHNLTQFTSELDDLCEATKLTVLRDLFGDRFEDMSPIELRFVGAQ